MNHTFLYVLRSAFRVIGEQKKQGLFFGLFAFLFLAACGGSEETKNTNAAVTCPVDEVDGEISLPVAHAHGALQKEIPSTRFIIKLAKTDGDIQIASLRKNRVADILQNEASIEEINNNFYKLEFKKELRSSDVAELLDSRDYEYIEPDFKVHTALSTNDTLVANQWAHKKINSAAAWDISRGSGSITVAVIDTGIDYNHPDLAGNMWKNPNEISNNGIDDDGNGLVDDVYGWNFVSNNNKPLADDASTYHGTHVAGTIGAVGNNGIGVSGHAQVVKLMALKFLGSGGSGYTSDAIKAVNYAVSKHVKVISNSWGSSSYSQSLSDAIDGARAAGILFVAAAGNSGSNNDTKNFYPANYPQDNIISVASSTSSDALSSFSSYGANTVDIAAPGSSIYSTKNGSSYQYLSGTSMATPLVSGVLATMFALRPDLSYSQIKSALLQNVDIINSMKGKIVSNGRINAYRALAAINNGATPPPGGVVPSPVITPPACVPAS